MPTSMDVDDLAKRPARYWNEDGLTELFVGLMIFVPACLFNLGGMLPKGSNLIMALPLVWIAVILALSRGLKTVKERVISPRTGYIALRQPSMLRRWGLAVVFVAVGFPTTHWISSFQRGSIAGLLWALIFILSWLWAWFQSKQPHYLLLAAVPLSAGWWIYREHLDLHESESLLLVAMGGALAISGALRLRSFLKTHPRVDAGI